eukprot:g14808.t1
MAAHYKSQVAEGEKVVVLYYHRSVRDDNEDRRLVTLLRQKGLLEELMWHGALILRRALFDAGLVPVQLPDEKGPREDQPRLVVRHGKVFITEKKSEQRTPDRSRSPKRQASPARGAKAAETSEPVGLVLTFGDSYHYKPDAEGLKKLEQQWELSNLPIEAQRAHLAAKELREAVEQLGGVVADGKTAQNQLFRMLRADDKEGWQRLMEGKQGVPGLLEAYYKGKVKVANGPGLILVEDKELCAYMDKLIQHYLGEAPILKTIPTRSFAADPQLLHTVFDIPSNQPNVVVKRVDGRGGNAVWVGAKLPRNDFLAARPLVAAEPEAFIVQRYTALSKVDGQITDLRGPAFITSSDEALSGGTGVAVSPVLWSRGVPADGSNGKVNISDAGFEFAVATALEKQSKQ